jgi:hypothetical protein
MTDDRPYMVRPAQMNNVSAAPRASVPPFRGFGCRTPPAASVARSAPVAPKASMPVPTPPVAVPAVTAGKRAQDCQICQGRFAAERGFHGFFALTCQPCADQSRIGRPRHLHPRFKPSEFEKAAANV